MGLAPLASGVTPRLDTGSKQPATASELQQQRDELVKQYVDARPRGSTGWVQGAAVAGGLVGAGAALAAVLIANRGRGSLYQGMNIAFAAPVGMLLAGGAGGYAAATIADAATRPGGAAATRQVAETRAGLKADLAKVDEQLSAIDGRRAIELPALDEKPVTGPSARRTAKAAAGGAGVGFVATGLLARTLGYGEFSPKQPSAALMLGPMVAGSATYAAVSYLNQRDEKQGRVGSFGRSAAIGATAFGAVAVLPGMAAVGPAPARIAAGLGIGALVGALAHTVSVSSTDGGG